MAGLALLGIAAGGLGAAYWHFRQSADQDPILCGGEHGGGNVLPQLPPIAPVASNTPVTANSLLTELRTKRAPIARC